MADLSIQLQPVRNHAEHDATTSEMLPAHHQSTPAGLVPGDEVPEGHQEFSLPPADGGKDAWLFLAACFMLEALVWGFPGAFGVFQDYYRTHEPFAGSSNIAIIGTCALGIMYLDMPIIFALQRRFPRATVYCPLVGLTAMCLTLATSSFSQTTTHLIATQGVLYAIFGSVTYAPCILYLEEWFVRRKGFAYGVMWAGTGTGGFALPLLMEHFLGQYGFRTTLRIWAVVVFVLTAPLTFFIKPRLPISANTHTKPYKLRFLLQPTFLLYQTASIVEAAGYFLPTIYLPTYARSILGAGSLQSALTVLLIHVTSAVGIIVMGFMTDRLHVTTCIMISTVGAVVGVFLFWGFATNLALLYSFCVIYGLFAGSYVSTWPGIMKQVVMASHPPLQDQILNDRDGTGAIAISAIDPIMVLAFLTAGRGVGNLVSGPVSEALILGLPWKGTAIGAWGSGYGTLVLFTGTTAVAGGATFIWKRFGWLK